jgi:hypothetical protein
MPLKPSSSRHTLALLGAALVVWGAWNPVLRMPVLGDINLFVLDAPAAWTLCGAVALCMIAVWRRKRRLAWLGFFVAVASVGLLCHDLYSRVEHLKEIGAPEEWLNGILRAITVKPGAVGVGSGLVILAVSLGLSRK